ncbi:MAG: acyl carrier protein [Candidatus Schekmanbacteria bacterium]|nr:acyl carrier protein [Candidatus Schekmanbacteria bacterium]
MDEQEVLDVVRRLVVELFGERPELSDLPIDTPVATAGVDSLRLMELLYAVEDTFDLRIPDEDVNALKTIGDLVRYVIAHAGASGRS